MWERATHRIASTPSRDNRAVKCAPGLPIDRMKSIDFAQAFARAPWRRRACARLVHRPVGGARAEGYATAAAPRARRGLSARGIVVAATVGSAGVTAAVYPDDARHAYQACQRSGRVVVGLAKCINEYVAFLELGDGARVYEEVMLTW